MQIKNSLILVGTVWPVVGVILAILISFLFTGWRRWLMLVIGPVLFLLPCVIFFNQIVHNENMLFMALMGTVYLFLLVYYPILVITGTVMLIRRKRSGPGS